MMRTRLEWVLLSSRRSGLLEGGRLIEEDGERAKRSVGDTQVRD